MQTLGEVATDNDYEYFSLGESIWHLLLMIKFWLKMCQSMILYTFAIYNIYICVCMYVWHA